MTSTRLHTRIVAPEILVVVGCIAVLVMWSLPPMLGVWVGAFTTVFMLVAGAAAGVVYHLRLHAALAPSGLRRGWWWYPTREHARLDRIGRARVMPWFIAGATGCAGAIVGCLGFLSAALRL
jgi:hypothetical protein